MSDASQVTQPVNPNSQQWTAGDKLSVVAKEIAEILANLGTSATQANLLAGKKAHQGLRDYCNTNKGQRDAGLKIIQGEIIRATGVNHNITEIIQSHIVCSFLSVTEEVKTVAWRTLRLFGRLVARPSSAEENWVFIQHVQEDAKEKLNKVIEQSRSSSAYSTLTADADVAALELLSLQREKEILEKKLPTAKGETKKTIEADIEKLEDPIMDAELRLKTKLDRASGQGRGKPKGSKKGQGETTNKGKMTPEQQRENAERFIKELSHTEGAEELRAEMATNLVNGSSEAMLKMIEGLSSKTIKHQHVFAFLTSCNDPALQEGVSSFFRENEDVFNLVMAAMDRPAKKQKKEKPETKKPKLSESSQWVMDNVSEFTRNQIGNIVYELEKNKNITQDDIDMFVQLVKPIQGDLEPTTIGKVMAFYNAPPTIIERVVLRLEEPEPAIIPEVIANRMESIQVESNEDFIRRMFAEAEQDKNDDGGHSNYKAISDLCLRDGIPYMQAIAYIPSQSELIREHREALAEIMLGMTAQQFDESEFANV